MTGNDENGCDIAIVGMGCRYPAARNPREFWSLLSQGVEAIAALSEEELQAAGVDTGLLANPSYVRADGVLDGIELFDAAFFGYTPREAELMDPQLRLFLEIAWEAIEDSGYSRDSLEARVGVYAGASMNSYLMTNIYSNPRLIDSVGTFQTTLLNNRDYLPSHVSYKLNLNGPSIDVQTACSTSLVAVHLACQALLGRECDIALAGGVSVRVPQGHGYLYEEGGILSRDGHCRAFDEKASGTVASSGAGAVVLKRLDEAISDRDFIYAVIKGTAVNNDGAVKAGFTAPTIDGQAAVIEEALAMAMVPPQTVTYLEAHGTGTPLGDPIEVAALTQAFRRHTNARRFCAIGSVKTNLGHLDAAAGVAGLIKAALALHHSKIPPSLNFEKPNPQIDFENSPFFVSTTLRDWTTSGYPRRAGVSSFGIGGTNAHAVLEEAPARMPGAYATRSNVLVLSAKSPTALDEIAGNISAFLSSHPSVDLPDIAYTLQVGRRGMEYRRAMVFRDRNEAIAALDEPRADQVVSGYWDKGSRPVAFVFSGQGAQYAGMAQGLYEIDSVFRNEADKCLSLLEPSISESLKSLLFTTAAGNETAGRTLENTALAQPALFIVCYALARELMSWGVKPDSMIGHSIGEYVAACVSGVMNLQDAVTLVALRGKLMSGLPVGAMLAVPLSEAETARYIENVRGLSLAAVNSAKLTVVSGATDSIALLEENLSRAGVNSKRLRVSHAFHSQMMDAILDRFAAAVAGVRLNPPRIPYISNVTGSWITAEQTTSSDYYARHLRMPVRFYQGITELTAEPDRMLVEIGPGGLLRTAIGAQSRDSDHTAMVETLRRPTVSSSDEAVLAAAVANLWVNGVDVDWDAFHKGEPRNRLPLPTYPFERKRYWIEPGESRQSEAELDRKQPDISKWFYRQSWKRSPLPRSPLQVEPDAGSGSGTKPRWLLFADRDGISEEVARLCQSKEIACVIVWPGPGFEKASETEYIVDPNDRESHVNLLKDLHTAGPMPPVIFHCWNESFRSSSNVERTIDHAAPLSYTSLVNLAQALGESSDSRSIEILSVTNQAEDVIGTEALEPSAMAGLGPCKVIPLEYPYLKCRAIDITSPAEPSALCLARIAGDLVDEALSGSVDRMVAYRNGHRWIGEIERIAVDLERVAQPAVKSDGAYLITGGMGEIEFEIANHLVELGARQLIIIGMPPLSGGKSWSDYAASNVESASAPEASVEEGVTIERLRELKSLGVELFINDAQTEDYQAMRAVVDRSRQRFGGIRGVVHTAFATGGGMIQLKTTESSAKVLAPKIKGAAVIDELVGAEALDFFILFSTSLAVTGVFGQSDYCAANAFLDAFATDRRLRKNANIVSIAWDISTWERWQEEAMASVPELQAQIRDVRERFGISPGEAVRCIDIALALNLPSVIISTRDFLKVVASQNEAVSGGVLDQIASVSLSGSIPDRKDRSSDFVSPSGEVEETIAAVWRDLFGIEEIGANDDFFSIGGNSLVAIQAISRLRKEFDVDLPMSALFEHPTISTLAAAILELGAEPDDASEMEALLAEIEGLTPEQVHAALAEEHSKAGD